MLCCNEYVFLKYDTVGIELKYLVSNAVRLKRIDYYTLSRLASEYISLKQ
jgi:hypothetical protein